jgi:hypothetical protein
MRSFSSSRVTSRRRAIILTSISDCFPLVDIVSIDNLIEDGVDTIEKIGHLHGFTSTSNVRETDDVTETGRKSGVGIHTGLKT